MADFKLNYTGDQINAAIGNAKDGVGTVVSGTGEDSDWQTITIDGVTKNIPAQVVADAYQWTGSATNYVVTSEIPSFPTTGGVILISGYINYCSEGDRRLVLALSFADLSNRGHGFKFVYKVKQNDNWINGVAHAYWNEQNQLGVYAANDGWGSTEFIITRITVTK